jgi:hypothetical protein
VEVRLAVAAVDDPGRGEDRAHLRVLELLVLRIEGVDRRRDDRDLVVVESLPHERLA